MKCRDCDDCKSNDLITTISIREEIEQDLINKSVTVKPDDQITVAFLPFTHHLITRLYPNRDKAMKVYNQQVKKLSNYPSDKCECYFESEAKLQKLAHVQFVKDLPSDVKNQLSLTGFKISYHGEWYGNHHPLQHHAELSSTHLK